MSNVFVFGSINMDMVFNVKRMPKRGETLKSQDFKMNPGGKGANQAVAAAQQESLVTMFGSLGDDGLSNQLLKTLQSYRVNTAGITMQQNQHAGIAGILLEGPENRIIIHPGANDKQAMSTLKERFKADAKKHDYLLSQLEVPLKNIEALFLLAQELGVKTVLNAAPAKPLNETFMRLIDLLVINESEAEILSNQTIHNQTDLINIAKELRQKGPERVIITLSNKGAYWQSASEDKFVKPYQINPLDTTGAGDAFTGVLVAKLAQNFNFDEAFDCAMAAGAYATQTKGAQEAMPNQESLKHFMLKYKKVGET